MTIARAEAPDGTELTLIEHDGSYVIMAGGLLLMSTRMTHSEVELARIGCEGIPKDARVLIGGLGCGFTLRETLNRLSPSGRVVQAELVPEIVAWNREYLSSFAEAPLDDARVELVIGDVGEVLYEAEASFDAILLDVDNGPAAIVTESNAWLYEDEGLQTIRGALKPGGRVVIWSSEDERGFLGRLRHNGLEPARHRVSSRKSGKGPSHVIFTGQAAAKPRRRR